MLPTRAVGRRGVTKGILAGAAAALWPTYAMASWPRQSPLLRLRLDSFDQVVIPRGHGMVLALRSLSYRARYPSRDHAMQLMIFTGSAGGILVHTTSSTGALTDWVITNNQLEIFSNVQQDVVTLPIGTRWQDGADIYAAWARDHMPRGSGGTSMLRFVATLSSNNMTENQYQAVAAIELFGKSVAGWLTQYRRFRFDHGYPDYTAADQSGYERLLDWCQTREFAAMPYFNALLVDRRYLSKSNAERWLLAGKDGGSRSYSSNLPHLFLCCPSSPWVPWLAQTILDHPSSIATRPHAVYLDVAGATMPHRCYSAAHSHAVGDDVSWVSGVRTLIELCKPRLVVIEGNAEVYNDVVDGYLMHEYTRSGDLVPLWSRVYGSAVNTYGWDMRDVTTEEELVNAVRTATAFGVSALGSPYMTSRMEMQFRSALGRLAAEVRE